MTTTQREKKILCRLLKQIRTEAGLRQVEVARRLSKPQSFVSKYESGEKTPSLIEVKQICDALGLTLQEFAKRLEEKL